MSKAPHSRSGRYGELDAGQLVDLVERSYERDEAADWELLFELSRRAMAADDLAGQGLPAGGRAAN